MTSANPPYPYFNGITYNSQFFNTSTSSSTGGLTQAQANLLYLQKTTNDTATALETFSAGILTNTIDAETSGELTIGGTNATSIALNEPVTMSGTLGVTGVLSANNANGLKTNKIEPLNTTGNDIVIGSTISSTNSVIIGKSTGGVGVAFPSGIKSNSIEPRLLTNNMTIGSTIDNANTITIGKNGSQQVSFPSGLITSNSTVGIVTPKLNAQVGAGLFIGSNSTSGVFIGNSGDTLGRVVTIDDTLQTSNINTMNIDNPTGELIIGVEATSVKLSYKYDPLDVLLYTSSIETDSTLTSNTINFHSNAEFETEYDSRIVASGGTDTNGQGTLGITANTLNLTGNTTVSNTLGITGITTATGGLRTNEIDRITSGSLAIGNNALTTAVSIQKPLTLSNPLILGSVPTLSTELGYTEVIGLASSNIVAILTGSETTLLTLPSLPAGVWSISYATKISGSIGTANITKFYTFVNPSPSITGISILAPSGGADSYSLGTGSTDASTNTNGSVIVKTTASTIFTLRYFMTSAAAVNFRQAGCYLTATRIA